MFSSKNYYFVFISGAQKMPRKREQRYYLRNKKKGKCKDKSKKTKAQNADNSVVNTADDVSVMEIQLRPNVNSDSTISTLSSSWDRQQKI